MIRIATLIAGFLLAGCATVPATADAGGECRNDGLDNFKGRTVSADLATELLKISGAKTLRWGPPDAALTMDFRADRLTVSYDRDSRVTLARCG
jgi:hypothetical protein